jgi:hypothetical protein
MTAINVTAEHIAKGQPGECAHCPVALAIRDALPDLAGAVVGPSEIGIQAELDGPWTDLDTPGDVTLFILLFDTGDHALPFTFDLDYPAVAA